MEALSGWVKQLPTEGKSSQYARIHTVKQLMLFRNSLGKHSYVPMDKIKAPKRPVIHVLSEYEIQELFTKIEYKSEHRYRELNLEMNILYDALEELKTSPKSVLLSRKVHALLHRESRFAAFKRIMCEIIKNIIQRQKSGLNNCFMIWSRPRITVTG